ncbi:hypothetical protein FOL47_005377 [Perkinsus chesapeaki]|uniref:DNA sliding clamp PCNA n=1 Tax=Perkinsus chesapeaki TaxID=330153 RepID=A0A7J6N2F9_PERCH|nr:hypothetical protein FOL47_005377 [Perkinsus chesapeaki]
MFECKLEQTVLFKKVVAAVLDIVKEGNFDLSDEGIRVQTMDTTHVALVQMELKESAFDEFRCDRECCVGINFEAMTKLLKLCRDDDSLSLKKEEDCDTLTITSAGEGRAVECDMNLMDIESEQLGVPDCEYACEIKMKCAQFAKICRDLKDCGGENLRIDCDKNSVKFSMKCDTYIHVRAAVHRTLRRVAQGVAGSCARPAPYFASIPNKRERNVCKFEIPYEAWKEGEPKSSRVVQRGRVFDFKLDGGYISTEGIECDDYFYNYHYRLTGLLKRRRVRTKYQILSYKSDKDNGVFLLDPLTGKQPGKKLYKGDANPGDPHECIDAMDGLWNWICEEDKLPKGEQQSDEALAHALLDGVCQLHAEKQTRFLEAIEDGRVKRAAVDGQDYANVLKEIGKRFGDRINGTDFEGITVTVTYAM